jgi:nitrous oxidase accessory protein NosD
MAVVALFTSACGGDGGADPAAAGPPTPSRGTDAGTRDLVRVPEDATTIAAAVDLVAPGGMVLVGPGTYPEEVTIDTTDVTLRGVDRNETIIDGGGVRSFGVFASADGVRIENLTVHSTMLYGVLATGMRDDAGPIARGAPGYEGIDPSEFPPLERFAIDHVTTYNNGLYGIYAFNARHGVIVNSYASGSADSGFYVGQCEQCDVVVTGNVAERNAVGFENANASDSVVVAGNRFTGNRIGMILMSSYQEAFTPQRDNVVVGNLVGDNANPESPAHALGSFGIGIAITGGQGNRIVANRIEANPAGGIVLANAEDIPAIDNVIAGNALAGNGVDVADVSAPRTPATGNCFGDNSAASSSPAGMLDIPCPGTTGAAGPAGPGALAVVEAPAGMSFLRVPVPPTQPSLSDVETPPAAPLPATVSPPDEAGFTVPDASLLTDRAAVS